MPTAAFLGEWEQLVLLVVLRLDDQAYVLPLRAELESRLGRRVSRGALYKTLDRLEQKGYASWTLQADDGPLRGGHPRRRFHVTLRGVRALRASRRALTDLWAGLEEVLG
ncbi:MAG: helix-turn-helix transcriptional regulator [Vicinamibacterales bacterium]